MATESEEMEQIFEGVVCVFGLKNQGHIPTIERMLSEGKSWDDIGLAIGWCPKTAEQHYGWHLKALTPNPEEASDGSK